MIHTLHEPLIRRPTAGPNDTAFMFHLVSTSGKPSAEVERPASNR